MLSYMLPAEDKSSAGIPRISHTTTSSGSMATATNNQQKNRLQLDLDSDSTSPRMTPIIRTIEVSETRYKELRHPVTGAVLDASRNEHMQGMVFSDPQALRDRLERTMIKSTNSGKVPFEKTTILKTHNNLQQHPAHNNNNTFDKCYNQSSPITGYGLGGVIRPPTNNGSDLGNNYCRSPFANERHCTNLNGADNGSARVYFNDSGVSTGDEDTPIGGGVSSSVPGGASPAASSDTSTPLAHNAGKKLMTGQQGMGKPGLKRVSFGSSKGSMVETLVYESPVGGALIEEPEFVSNRLTGHSLEDEHGLADGEDSERSRVRVTFFQSSRPQCVSPANSASPENCCDPLLLSSSYNNNMAATATRPTVVYDRQISNESGWDNPFRPDGELSREADEIVSMIKGGHPITPVTGSAPAPIGSGSPGTVQENGSARTNGTAAAVTGDAADGKMVKKEQTTLSSAAVAVPQNGSKSPAKGGASSPVAVQRGTVPQQSTPQQAELVVLKKKPKCKCCVIQ